MMSASRKYANLPDLDQSQEVYQTNEDDENATTVQAESASSRESTPDESDEERSGIERRRLDPDSSRSHFASSRVDATNANFSDQVGRHRRSYYVTSSRREEDEDDLDPEQRLKKHNLSRRIGRMQQLLEDLKNDIADAKEQGEWKETSLEEEDQQDDEALVKISEALHQLTVTDRSTDSATTRMKRRAAMKRDSSTLKLRTETSSAEIPSKLTEQSPNYTQISDPQALAVYTKFSSRLDTLEALIGLDSLPPPDLPSVKDFPMPLIKMTDIMAKQMNLLNDVGEPFLNDLSQKIQTVTKSAEELEQKRSDAKKGYEELLAAKEKSTTETGLVDTYSITTQSSALSGTTKQPGENDAATSPSDADNPLIHPELLRKISGLHSHLPAIESLAPILHPTLERLRALKEVHQDSASAHTRLNDLEQHEAEIQKQLKQWRDSLVELEGQTNELEEEWLENMGNIEKHVKNLEARIHAL